MFSNMGFTLATHYCGGHAVKSKLMLGIGELDCGMAKSDKSCESDSMETSVKKKGCCENQYISINLEDEYQPSALQANLDYNFVFTFVYTFVELLNSQVELDVVYDDYSPPLRYIDVQVLFQSFLI